MLKLLVDVLGSLLKALLQIALLLAVLLSFFAGYHFATDWWAARQREINERKAEIARCEKEGKRVRGKQLIAEIAAKDIQGKLGPKVQALGVQADAARAKWEDTRKEAERYKARIDSQVADVRRLAAEIEKWKGIFATLGAWISMASGDGDPRPGLEKQKAEAEREQWKLVANLKSVEKEAEELLKAFQIKFSDFKDADSLNSGVLEKLRREEREARAELDLLQKEQETHHHELGRLQDLQSKIEHYYRRALDQYLPSIAAILIGLVFGPVIWRAFLFVVWSRVIGLARPICFHHGQLPRIGHASNDPSPSVVLLPSERLLVRPDFLLSSDEPLRRGIRWFLNRRFPFTSIATGLHELVELRNEHGSRSFSATLAHQRNPDVELAEFELLTNGSLILRPTFLAGFIGVKADPICIRTRWDFGVHAWRTLQFRHFEFFGPCRLLVWGHRGVRVEHSGDALDWSRRINSDATIGFTPNLRRSSIRTEHIWLYLRGKNPLFDDLFAGECGSYLSQRVAHDDKAASGGARFWERVWNTLCKVVGV